MNLAPVPITPARPHTQNPDEKYFQSLRWQYLQQLQRNAQDAQSNANTSAQFQNQMAGQGYNLAGDMANQQQRMAGMQGDLLSQQQHNNQFNQNLNMDVARGQTNLLNQQQNNNQYLWGADESLARTAYQRSMNEIPNGFGQAMSKFGYR